MIHLDTTFVVDLVREKRRRSTGAAHAWLEANPEAQIAVSIPVVCEILLGAEMHADPKAELRRVEKLISSLVQIQFCEDVPGFYARTAAALIRKGVKLSTMDLLIGSIALRENAAVLTRNTKHFERIPGLHVLTY